MSRGHEVMFYGGDVVEGVAAALCQVVRGRSTSGMDARLSRTDIVSDIARNRKDRVMNDFDSGGNWSNISTARCVLTTGQNMILLGVYRRHRRKVTDIVISDETT